MATKVWFTVFVSQSTSDWVSTSKTNGSKRLTSQLPSILQPLASVTVTTYVFGGIAVKSSVVAPLDQDTENGGVPP